MTDPAVEPSLADFFAAMRPFLLGETSVTALEASLGHSPTGSDGLAFYATFLRRHERLLLQRQFKAAYHLIDRFSDLDWPSLVHDFIRAHPPSSWSMYRTGEPFSAWLLAQIEAGVQVPAAAPYLVDFAWTRWLARNAPRDAPLMEGQVFVRQYPVDVVVLNRSLCDTEDPPQDAPGPKTLVIFRHLQSGDVFHFTPSLATLAVLDSASGTPSVDWPAQGVTPAMQQSERDQLVQRGVLQG